MKNKILFLILFFLAQIVIVHAQLQVTDNNTVKLGGQKANMYLGKVTKYGGSPGSTFNPAKPTVTGLVLENGMGDPETFNPNEESSGIYFDCDYVTLWSPGDGGVNGAGTTGYLVKVYDEDNWQLRWYIDGTGNNYFNSDSTRKENIEPISSSMGKIMKMRSVRYDFKKTDEERLKFNDASKAKTLDSSDSTNKSDNIEKCLGFIAQEMEEILPEVVQTDEKGDKFINYIGIIPIAVQAIQEQQQLIDSQQQQIETQKLQIESVKQQLELLMSDIECIKKDVTDLMKRK